MTKPVPLTRSSTAWLLVAAGLAVIPSLFYLPGWIIPVVAVCFGWRYQVWQNRWSLPGKWVRFCIVLLAVALVLMEYGTVLGPSAGTALLVLGYSFKLLETQHQRDGFLLVVLGFVVIAACFFFTQSMLVTAFLFVVFWVFLSALTTLYQHRESHWRQPCGQAGKMMLHALPLMLVMFLLVPRIAPLWSLDLSESRAKTGLSDEIALGDIASLSQSDELAFRVVFDGQVPDKGRLYWRALVLDHYDGERWSRGTFDMDQSPMISQLGPGRGWHQQLVPQSAPVDYQVLMEPTDKPWLFSLAGLVDFNRDYGYSLDHRLVSPNPVSQPIAYNLRSALDYQMDRQLPRWMQDKSRQLPEQGDIQTRALASRLWAATGSEKAFIQQVLNYFTTQGFSYTLRPGQMLSADKVDEFLFNTRAGFCSHYASAFVYLMRSAGIPARLVAGYQGGEMNELGGYLLVHQFDAHAWAEVWVAGEGWVRVDPTAAISPERVNQGIEDAMASEQSFLENSPLSPARYRHLSWLTQIRHSIDYLNYAWYRAVIGYDAETQLAFLSRWLGEVNIKSLALWLLAAVASILLLLGLLLLGKQWGRKEDPLLAAYQGFCGKMAVRGYQRRQGESPDDYAKRLADSNNEQAASIYQITRTFQRQYYRGTALSEPLRQKAAQVIRRLTREL